MCAGFEAPTTPLGYNELQIAGAMRGKPVELAKCLTVEQNCIANAEYVLEGYLSVTDTIQEDIHSHTGKAMPEFPGYTGDAKPALNVIHITAVTTRQHPIMESCIGPSHEHVSMAGIPTEASIYKMVETAIPGRLLNVHAAPCGGGKFVAILQFKKSSKNDEGRQRNAAMLAFSAFSELKHVFLVDPDVDIFDMSDVMWAMTTRFQADVDLITIPGCHCHVLDPSNDPSMDPSIRVHGIACKAIFDCTVPFDQQKNFVRSQFLEIDKDKWASELAF
jgi:4-hydroxy-3-polyprenylbenzoate decarboxylase